MEFLPINTRPLIPPKDDICNIFDVFVNDIKDGDIIFITSKILAIHQGRCILVGDIEKTDLIKKEADLWIISDIIPGKDMYITMKNNIIIPSAGIDESNANGYFILRPNELDLITKEIHSYFCEKYQIENLGVIITDSTTKPGKLGVVGISIYSYGIYPLIDVRGEEDIFGKKLEITQINVIDSLSAIAVYLMGEGNECKPITIGRNIPRIKYSRDNLYDYSSISIDQDLYKPILENFLKG